MTYGEPALVIDGDLDDSLRVLAADQQALARRPLNGALAAEDHALTRVARQDQAVGAEL